MVTRFGLHAIDAMHEEAWGSMVGTPGTDVLPVPLFKATDTLKRSARSCTPGPRCSTAVLRAPVSTSHAARRRQTGGHAPHAAERCAGKGPSAVLSDTRAQLPVRGACWDAPSMSVD
jgi:hypothetical protein